MKVKERLLKHINITNTGCWEWAACTHRTGYGKVNVDHKTSLAHRVSYQEFIGPIPEGLDIDHLCRNRKCINPDHLEPVTRRENLARGAGQCSSHCKKGHEFTLENTRIYRNTRRCRICSRRYHQEYARRKIWL